MKGMVHSQFHLVVLLLASPILFGTRTGATEGLPHETTLKSAVALKERALDSGKANDWSEALRSFLHIARTAPTPEVHYEVGFAAAQIGLVALAVEYYVQALNGGLQGPAATRARLYVGTHRSKLGEVEVHLGEGSKLSVNGYERTPAPSTSRVLVDPGLVHLELIHQTGRTITREVTLAAGEVTQVDLETIVAETTAQETKPDERQAESPATPGSSNRELHEPAPRLARPFPSLSKPQLGVVTPYRHTGIALIAGGTAASVLGLLAIPWSTSNIENARLALAQACDVPSTTPDGCSHSKQGRREEAQSNSDSIATWTAARYVAWGTLGAGLATIGTGTILMTLKSNVPMPQITLDSNHFQATFTGRF